MGGPGKADQPVVDIGIPVFRRATFLAEAIGSVLAQTYPRWRLSVSEDGGATDAVREVVAPFLADPRIHYAAQPERLGLARHKSLLATGTSRYLALLDDDDTWFPHWLERRVEFLDAHPECGMVFGGHVDVTPDGNRSVPLPSALPRGVLAREPFVRTMMTSNMVATPSALIRRRTYDAAGGRFDPAFTHINDYELWLRIGLQGPVGVLDAEDSGYRVHANQMSRRHDRAADHLRLVGHLDSLLAAHAPELRLSPEARRRQTAERSLSVALDAAIGGRRVDAARFTLRAARLSPMTLASRRGLAAMAATALGTTLARRLAPLRP